MSRAQHFSRDTVYPARWPRYARRVVVRALRVTGPFTVETCAGTRACPDGYLLLNEHGWPYPIAREDFEAIYVLAEETPSAAGRAPAVPCGAMGGSAKRDT